MYAAENARFAEAIKVSPSVFSTPTVALELPDHLKGNEGATAAFMFAGNMLSRIFGRLFLVAPNAALGINPWRLRSLRDLVEPLAGLSEGSVLFERPHHVDIAVGVGAPPTVDAKHATFFSFSEWTAGLDTQLDNSAKLTPLGALFAACYGASQAFVYSTRMFGAEYRPIRPFVLSLLNYEEANVPAPTEIEPAHFEGHLVGVGAVGSAFVCALGHISNITGKLRAFDNDYVDSTNLNRYVLMRKEDAIPLSADDLRGRAKVKVAAEALRGSGVTVDPHAITFDEYRSLHSEPIELLLTPVDSEAGRRKLAAHIPKLVLNVATGHSKVTVSRHGFADGKACLRCLYLQPANVMTTEKRIAEGLGLTVDEVEDHLASNRPVDSELLRRVESHRALVRGALKDFVGQHIQSLYQRAVCGEAAIKTGGGVIVSPLSFISAAGGVFLAAELMKHATPSLRPYLLDNHFRVDTMMAPNPFVKCIKPQSRDGRCICEDETYVAVYRKKFT